MYEERGFGGRGGGFRDGGRGFGNDRQLTPPVRDGQELDITIEAVGEKGDGIGKVQGFVLFVPSTKAGERVRVRVTKVLAKVGFAQVIGEAQTAADAPPAQRERSPKPEFNPNEEMDSEDFGDDSEGSGDADGDDSEGNDDDGASTDGDELSENSSSDSMDDSDDSEDDADLEDEEK